MEAAACGLPLIISDRVNIWNDFFASKACLVAPPVAHDFANKIRVVLEAPQEARLMAGRAKEVVQQKFTWGSAGARLEAAYQHIIQFGNLPKLASLNGA